MTEPLLCVTVTAPTTAALREARDRAAHADLVELRLDTVSDPDVAGALAGRQKPVIVTCRAAWEGGSFKGAEDERRRLALPAGPVIPDQGRRIALVIGNSDYQNVPLLPNPRRDAEAIAASLRSFSQYSRVLR